MVDCVKFRFDGSAVLGVGFTCRRCAIKQNFLDHCRNCPVVRYACAMPSHVVLSGNNSWWANKNAENINVIVDDMGLRWRSYKQCQKLAAQCQYSKER